MRLGEQAFYQVASLGPFHDIVSPPWFATIGYMIELHAVSKAYRGAGADALSAVTLAIKRGEFVAVLGNSGAGKSTLFKLIAAIERPSAGTVKVAGQDISRLSAAAVPFLRRKLGMTFQDQKLLADRTALDNVVLPLMYTGASFEEASARARAALDKVGMRDREATPTRMLSGGEQQRVAIARAIVNRPAIVLADEPTANLDAANAARIIEIFAQFHRLGTTVLVATHDPQVLMGVAQRSLRFESGRLIEDRGREETAT